MPRLSLLGLPCLTLEILDFFRVNGIHTVEDFLTADLYTLPGLAGIGAEAEQRKEAVTGILDYLSANHVGGWATGEALLQTALKGRVYSTGCPSLDKLLGGGLREGTVTELVGSSATGKTQVCMQSAASAALRHGAAVAYVDTSNSFSSQRIAYIIGGLVGSKDRLQEMKGEVSRAMRSLVRLQAFDIYALLGLLEEISTHCRRASQDWDFFAQMRVLVVDSPSAIIAPVLGGAHSQGHALMICVSRTLKRMASEFRLAVLVTNHTVSGEAGQPKPALGESWKSAPHVRVLFKRDPSADLCTAALLKHSSLPLGEEVTFRIVKGGVQSSEQK